MRKVLLDIKKRIPLSNYITAMEKEKKYFITFVYFIIICNKNKKVNILCKKIVILLSLNPQKMSV